MIVPLTTGADATEQMQAQIAELVEQGRTKNQLQESDFLALMIAQIQNQDPLDPLSDQQFVQQITQFNILDQVTAFNDGLESMQAFQATGLIGRQVEGVLQTGEVVRGEVVEVILLNGAASLVLDTGRALALEDVVRVLQPAEVAPTPKAPA